MFIAAYQGHKECIETLAGLGGDVNKANTVSVSSMVHIARHVQS